MTTVTSSISPTGTEHEFRLGDKGSIVTEERFGLIPKKPRNEFITGSLSSKEAYAITPISIDHADEGDTAEYGKLDFPDRERDAQLDLYQGRETVDGAILEVEHESVYCELYKEGINTKVYLPKSLFSGECLPGMPFSLGIIDKNGIRTPYVTRRTVSPERTAQVEREFDEIIQKLDE